MAIIFSADGVQCPANLGYSSSLNSDTSLVTANGGQVLEDVFCHSPDSDHLRRKSFLESLWSSDGTSHWLTTRNALTGAFQSSRVGSVNAAIGRAADLSRNGFDISSVPTFSYQDVVS